MRFSGLWLAVLHAALWIFAASASGQENYLNPGTMGPNAMPPSPCESPWIGDDWLAEIGLGIQNALGPTPTQPLQTATDGQRAWDQSLTIPFHAEYRIVRRAAVMVEGTPIEAWLVSGVTQELWGTPNALGVSKGDIRIGGKFLLYSGKGWIPAATFRAWVKTTTGKSVEDHRFINAPAYQFDALFGEHFRITDGVSFEIWAAAGFLAWQQQQFGQNDAITWATTFSLRWDSGTAVRLFYQGYRGWLQDDKPQAVTAALELPLSQKKGSMPEVTAVLALTQSFRDPVYTGFRFSIRVGSIAQPISTD